MNSSEQKAITLLEKAFQNASKLGIKICAMDNTVYYATKDAFVKGTKIRESKSRKHQAPYCEVAEAILEKITDAGVLKTYNCYTDSGGW